MFQGRIFPTILLAFFPVLVGASIPKVNVLIGKDLSQVIMEGQDLKHQDFQEEGFKAIRVDCNDALVKSFSTTQTFKVSSAGGLINWNNAPYRGDLLVKTHPGKRSCDLINAVPMEDYISSLLSKEMNKGWHIEALKAQAVAARSYAYFKMQGKSSNKEHDVENSEKDQVTGTFFDQTERTSFATRSTRGEILVTNSGKMIPIFFHARCGGKTRRPDQIWHHEIEGYDSVFCPHCDQTHKSSWDFTINRAEFYRDLGLIMKDLGQEISTRSIVILPDEDNLSYMRFYDGNNDMWIVPKSRLRKFYGRINLNSNNFQIVQREEKIYLSGKGLGHGVGMCQIGALSLAKKGLGYREILAHYFPHYNIKKIY